MNEFKASQSGSRHSTTDRQTEKELAIFVFEGGKVTESEQEEWFLCMPLDERGMMCVLLLVWKCMWDCWWLLSSEVERILTLMERFKERQGVRETSEGEKSVEDNLVWLAVDGLREKKGRKRPNQTTKRESVGRGVVTGKRGEERFHYWRKRVSCLRHSCGTLQRKKENGVRSLQARKRDFIWINRKYGEALYKG